MSTTPLAHRLRRRLSVYSTFTELAPKLFVAFRGWVWVDMFVQALSMVVFVYFWRAVYANNDTIAGLTLQQTLNYILLARILGPIMNDTDIFYFGFLLREGVIAVEMLRPVDLQLRFYTYHIGRVLTSLVISLPLAVLAIVAFGLQLPGDPLVWLCFFVTLALGHAVAFCFDWAFLSLAFYTTETWGLGVLREGIVMFFSGSLIPLVMLPGWLQGIAQAMPFAQALYVPLTVLSGQTPLSGVPGLWLTQIVWLVGLLIFSRWVFAVSVRKVTVQGG